jgi:hypothetical protein
VIQLDSGRQQGRHTAQVQMRRRWRGQTRGFGAAAGLSQKDQLHHMLIHRRAGGLQKAQVTTADGLLNPSLRLAVG